LKTKGSKLVSMASNRIIGLDIGMKADYSALVCLNLREKRVSAIQRWKLGTSLLKVADDSVSINSQLNADVMLIDATMNHSVYENIRKQSRIQVIPITITAGNKQSKNRFGGWNVSKTRLIHTLMNAIENKRFTIPSDPPELMNELMTMKSAISKAGNLKYEASPGNHDDLVMALTLAVWWAYKGSQSSENTLIGGNLYPWS